MAEMNQSTEFSSWLWCLITSDALVPVLMAKFTDLGLPRKCAEHAYVLLFVAWDKAAPAWGTASSRVNLFGNNPPGLHCCQYLLGRDSATEQTLTAKAHDEKEEGKQTSFLVW